MEIQFILSLLVGTLLLSALVFGVSRLSGESHVKYVDSLKLSLAIFVSAIIFAAIQRGIHDVFINLVLLGLSFIYIAVLFKYFLKTNWPKTAFIYLVTFAVGMLVQLARNA